MYIVVDVGGSFIKYGLMDLKGNILTKRKSLTPKNNLEEFEREIYAIIESFNLSRVKGIAFSCPGTINTESGVIYYGGFLPFLHEVNLARKIYDKYNIDVSIENDGKCAALAELWQGNVKDKKNSIVLVLGSGVAGGIIIDGKLFRGNNFSAGEVSFVTNQFDPITEQNEYVGFNCSAVRMINRIGEIKKLEDKNDGKKVFEYINNNDEEANKIFDAYCLDVANLIMNLQYILDPEIFAIGGGISAQPYLVERINWAINKIIQSNSIHIAKPMVVACKFQNDANLYGALYNHLIKKNHDLTNQN